MSVLLGRRARFARAFRVRIPRAAVTLGSYVSLPLVFRKTEHVNAAGAVRAFRARISRAHFARGSNMGKLGFGTHRFSQNRACQCCWGGARVSRGAGTWGNYVSLPSCFAKPSMSVLLKRPGKRATGAGALLAQARCWRRRAAGAGALLAEAQAQGPALARARPHFSYCSF